MRVIALKLFYYSLLLISLFVPQVGVYFYQFISIIRPEQLTHGVSQISGLFAISIISIYISFIFKKRINIACFYSNGLFFVILFISSLFISTYLSPYTVDSGLLNYTFLFSLIQIYLFLVILNTYINEKNIKYFILFELILFFLMALWGIQQRFHGNILVENLFGTSIRDRCAITAIFVLVLPLSLCLGKRTFLTFFKYVSLLSFVLLIFFTDSRAGFLGFVFSLLFLFYFKKNKVKTFIYGLLFLIISLAFVPDSYIDRMDSISYQNVSNSDEITDRSSAGRLVLWRLGMYVIQDNPLLGVGNLNFRVASKNYVDNVRSEVDPTMFSYIFGADGKSLIVHNLFINALAEGGLFSSVPLFLFIGVPFFILLRKKNRSALDISISAGVFGFMVCACFANMTFIDFWYWHVFLMWKVSSMDNVDFTFIAKTQKSLV